MARGQAGVRHSGIRWDRVGRTALLGTLGVILLLYVSPAKQWITQSRTADEHRAEVRRVSSENERLRQRIGVLRQPDALEREARKLGMVRLGERPYVIQGLPR